MRCAFKIIEEPITYYKDSNEIFVEQKHPKVNNLAVKGIIKDSELCDRIIKTVYNDEYLEKRTSVMQFSNLLHLIYLNSK